MVDVWIRTEPHSIPITLNGAPAAGGLHQLDPYTTVNIVFPLNYTAPDGGTYELQRVVVDDGPIPGNTWSMYVEEGWNPEVIATYLYTIPGFDVTLSSTPIHVLLELDGATVVPPFTKRVSADSEIIVKAPLKVTK